MNNKAHQILEVAADWCDRLETLTPAERRELNAWLAADPEHARAYDRMRRTMTDVALFDVTETLKDKKAGIHIGALLSHAFSSRATYGVLVGIAAVVIAVIFLRPSVQQPVAVVPPGENRILATATSQTRNVTLADKSQVYLNADTRIAVAFSSHTRELTLSRGEAIFQVTHDKARPFRVITDTATVIAVGTRFGVDRIGDAVEVRVYEGTVKVQNAAAVPTTLTQGHWLLIDKTRGITEGTFVPEQYSNWRDGWLVADRMPLPYVIERLNRYTDKKIALADRRLVSEDVSGRFRLDRTQATVAQLSALLNLSVEENRNEILLKH